MRVKKSHCKRVIWPSTRSYQLLSSTTKSHFESSTIQVVANDQKYVPTFLAVQDGPLAAYRKKFNMHSWCYFLRPQKIQLSPPEELNNFLLTKFI
jgi:hypothetical protein